MKFAPGPGILDLAAYVAGESTAPGAARIIKLSSNENPFGTAPKALAALKADQHLEKYPDSDCTALRGAIAAKFGLESGRIVCGSGSDEIIGLLCQSYLMPGDNVVYADHSFLMYGIYARACGAATIEVAEKDLCPDLGALLAAVTPKTKIVFLTNPNNPTGSFNLPADIKSFREKLPPHVILVLDDAYAEYAAATPGYENGFALAQSRDDVVVLRTFSKIYGMAGLRFGYGYVPEEIASVLHRVRGPFNVSVPAQMAGVAALGDDDFIEKSVAHNTQWRAWTKKSLENLGLKVWPSVANFLLVDFDGGADAEACRLFLKDRGILVRQMGAYKLPNSLRISIGAGDEMEIAVAAIRDCLGR